MRLKIDSSPGAGMRPPAFSSYMHRKLHRFLRWSYLSTIHSADISARMISFASSFLPKLLFSFRRSVKDSIRSLLENQQLSPGFDLQATSFKYQIRGCQELSRGKLSENLALTFVFTFA